MRQEFFVLQPLGISSTRMSITTNVPSTGAVNFSSATVQHLLLTGWREAIRIAPRCQEGGFRWQASIFPHSRGKQHLLHIPDWLYWIDTFLA
jgi:hypothetical protein